jgi:predicted 2-oxoglutarate/Fe(II)-dependent dioxygenase YbiX
MFTSKDTIAPGIVVYKNALIGMEDIVDSIENEFSTYFNPATVVSLKEGGEAISEQHRKVKSFNMNNVVSKDFSKKQLTFYNFVKESILECLYDYINIFDLTNSELVGDSWILLKYDKEDFFKSHVDNGVMFPRIVSVTGYFNDDYDGGEISYDKFNIKYKPKAGDVIIFPSDYVYSHEVEKINNGVRYAVVNWFRWKEWPLQISIDK